MAVGQRADGKEEGSSGKIIEQVGRKVEVNWGDGDVTDETHGVTVVTCETAGKRGIEPWADAFK